MPMMVSFGVFIVLAFVSVELTPKPPGEPERTGSPVLYLAAPMAALLWWWTYLVVKYTIRVIYFPST